MRTIHQWLDEYGESHKNETNKLIHWICVPFIFFTITGLFYSIKLPFFLSPSLQLNVAMILILMITVYYFMLSKTIWVGMLFFGLLCLVICHFIERSGIAPLWLVCIILFIAAWAGQFFGHKVEGKKPSFLKDIQFLMIGPVWLMSFIYGRLGIRL
ncbi:MAG: Mpo1-like protein [Ginsengibacter sp.]